MTLLVAALSSAFAVGALWHLLDPPRPLSKRLGPYLAAGRSVGVDPGGGGLVAGGRSIGVVVLASLAERLGGVVDGLSRDALVARLRQARMFQDTDDPAGAYRLRQLGSVGLGCAGPTMTGSMLGMNAGQVAAFAVLGLVVGVTRQRGRLERAIEYRRRRMTIEIYTIDQILALRVRAGSGVIQAVTQIVARGAGEVVEELSEALRLHRAGLPAAAAFQRIAETTPEPACARSYRFLALAEERGADLADGLLSLAGDVREARREAIRRAATRRRAAMLVPTIAILAPVMLLFVGAPLPALVLGFT